LVNLGPEALYCLWAAHPQFACDPGTRIVIPDGVEEVINALPLDWGEEWGPAGTRNRWPAKIGLAGHAYIQDVVGSPALRRGRKFYIPPDTPVSRVGLVRPATGGSLWLEWDPVAVTCCGVWIDEGLLNARPSVAIEPTTGYYDTLNTAWANRRLAVVGPGVVASWEIVVQLNRV
jgi:hypothetical protein